MKKIILILIILATLVLGVFAATKLTGKSSPMELLPEQVREWFNKSGDAGDMHQNAEEETPADDTAMPTEDITANESVSFDEMDQDYADANNDWSNPDNTDTQEVATTDTTQSESTSDANIAVFDGNPPNLIRTEAQTEQGYTVYTETLYSVAPVEGDTAYPGIMITDTDETHWSSSDGKVFERIAKKTGIDVLDSKYFAAFKADDGYYYALVQFTSTAPTETDTTDYIVYTEEMVRNIITGS